MKTTITLALTLWLGVSGFVSAHPYADESDHHDAEHDEISPRAALLDLDDLDDIKSRHSREFAHLKVRNHDEAAYVVHWIGFDGSRHRRAYIAPGDEWSQRTYAGHVWLITDDRGTPRQLLRPERECEIDVRSLRSLHRRNGDRDSDRRKSPFARDPELEPGRVRTRSDGSIPGAVPVRPGASGFPGAISNKAGQGFPGAVRRLPSSQTR
ncbi:MAG: hypothetical protein AAF585_18570 [Verrucomicrobiota bacterium]